MSTAESEFTIRKATAGDGEAIEQLFIESPDEGEISFAPRFSHGAHEAYSGLRTDSTGFVAETDDGRLAGIGYVSFTEARFGGEVRPSALLNAIAVHPDFRGQGLAKRIANHRIEYACKELGEDCVAFANIQHGNAASKAVAESWADEFAYDFLMYPAPPHTGEAETGEYDIQEADDDQLAAAFAAANEFHSETEVYRPWDTDEFERLRAGSPIEEPLHRYIVATADGEVVAGGVAMDAYKVMKLVVDSLPPALEEADELPDAIPESKELKLTMLSDLWYADGHESALNALWERVRSTPRGANRIMLNYDPDGRIGNALDINPEGAIETSVAVSGPTRPNAEVAPEF